MLSLGETLQWRASDSAPECDFVVAVVVAVDILGVVTLSALRDHLSIRTRGRRPLLQLDFMQMKESVGTSLDHCQS